MTVEMLAARKSFITETMFSDPVGAKLGFLRDAIAAGCAVHLIFIGLAGPLLSEGRVSQRVAKGGHDVPPDRLERMFRQSLENLRAAVVFVPDVSVFDNTSNEAPYQLVLAIRQRQRTFVAASIPRWLRKVVLYSARDVVDVRCARHQVCAVAGGRGTSTSLSS